MFGVKFWNCLYPGNTVYMFGLLLKEIFLFLLKKEKKNNLKVFKPHHKLIWNKFPQTFKVVKLIWKMLLSK